MRHQLEIDTDIKLVSDFRANAAEMIEQVRSSGRPLMLTQHGHSAAVLLEEIELLSDVCTAMKQIESGQGVSNRKAKAELRQRFTR